MSDEDLNDYTDFSVHKIEMTKESAELIKIIRTNLSELFSRDVSLAETINMLVAMGIEEWNRMQQEEEANSLV